MLLRLRFLLYYWEKQYSSLTFQKLCTQIFQFRLGRQFTGLVPRGTNFVFSPHCTSHIVTLFPNVQCILGHCGVLIAFQLIQLSVTLFQFYMLWFSSHFSQHHFFISIILKPFVPIQVQSNVFVPCSLRVHTHLFGIVTTCSTLIASSYDDR